MQKVLAKYKGMAKKKKNGGFTLVELIIVIAIIAVLVAILAPQYLQYVEKSRVSADESTADQILTAAKVAASDENTDLTAGAIYTIVWTNPTATTSTVTVAATPAGTVLTSLETSLGSALGVDLSSGSNTLSTYIKSAAHKKDGKFTVTIDLSSGSPVVSSKWGA